MLVKDFITKEFPALKKTDTAKYALSVMSDLKIRHLPVVADEIYCGLLSEKDVSTLSESTDTMNDFVLSSPSIGESEHLHEVIAQMSRYRLTLLPVVSPEGKYLGVITRDKVFEALADLCHAEASGSVVVLELFPYDYALSDIARIIEANNAHVLNLLSNTDKDTGKLILTIKIDVADATPTIRSFERFNYTVLYHFSERGMVNEALQRRIDELMYYMSM
ncbi:MAG: CBS domain-containing protein [Tannerellaceae bacterium]|jgi:CBS domain-containing protein|nr:CBS domain-containing protein [Tannerellaceae bacterium]